MEATCSYCGKIYEICLGHYNRAKAVSPNMYCSRTCNGMARRKNQTIEEKKRLKHEYDLKYRAENIERKTLQRKEYHKRTYDPQKAAVIRKANMPRHVEYCRRPVYREYKKVYDAQYRAKKMFGEFWECAITLFALEENIDYREAVRQNNLYNKKQKRKKLWKNSQQTT